MDYCEDCNKFISNGLGEHVSDPCICSQTEALRQRAEKAEERCKELETEVDKQAHRAMDAETSIDYFEGKIIQLQEALRDYGEHSLKCQNKEQLASLKGIEGCICGLARHLPTDTQPNKGE